MKPWRRPSAHRRVPTKNSVSGITNADADAIRPKVTMPLAKAWPAEPRIVNAVMLVPKSDSRKIDRPERAAGQEEVLGLAIGRPAVAEREDADVEDDREVGEDEDRWNQRRGPSSSAASSSR